MLFFFFGKEFCLYICVKNLRPYPQPAVHWCNASAIVDIDSTYNGVFTYDGSF